MTTLDKLQSKPAPDGLSQSAVRGTDVVISNGLSVHFFGKTVGIYSTRIQSGRGFAELPVSDLQALVDYFRTPDAQNLLRGD